MLTRFRFPGHSPTFERCGFLTKHVRHSNLASGGPTWSSTPSMIAALSSCGDHFTAPGSPQPKPLASSFLRRSKSFASAAATASIPAPSPTPATSVVHVPSVAIKSPAVVKAAHSGSSREWASASSPATMDEPAKDLPLPLLPRECDKRSSRVASVEEYTTKQSARPAHAARYLSYATRIASTNGSLVPAWSPRACALLMGIGEQGREVRRVGV